MASKLVGIILLLISFIVGWGWMEYQSALNESVVTDKTVLVEIEKGDTFNRITEKLIQKNLPIKPFWFKLFAYQKKITNKLKAGEYELKVGLTTPQILTLFTEGKTRHYSITFPEGWTFKQILLEIKKHKEITQTINNLSHEEIMAEIDKKNRHPEGLFFPDTYFFVKNTTDLSLLKKAFYNMEQVLADEWSKKEPNLPLANDYEALILASIVEKETGVPSERPIIAGVFTRRLIKGMLLQTDPTVIYGMGESYKGNIRTDDLTRPTPYNTYVIKGLPPTPIAMPGREAINAVLHPAKGSSLYFVARGDGTHVFSTTFKDHNRAVDIFQRKLKR